MRVRVLRVLAVSAMLALVGPLAQPAGAITVGEGGGCTPGFWKNHTGAWQEHSPSDPLQGPVIRFTIPDQFSGLRTKTFLQALSFKGGDSTFAAAKLLLKHAVAAFLNAAHDGIQYPLQRYTDGGIQDRVNAALASGDRQTMLDLKTELDDLANAECQAGGGNNTTARRRNK